MGQLLKGFFERMIRNAQTKIRLKDQLSFSGALPRVRGMRIAKGARMSAKVFLGILRGLG